MLIKLLEIALQCGGCGQEVRDSRPALEGETACPCAVQTVACACGNKFFIHIQEVTPHK